MQPAASSNVAVATEHSVVISSAVQPAAASAAAGASPCYRYLCSIYSLNPLRRPDMHRVVCLLLAKTRICDDELRAFIAQHIDTADVPDWYHLSNDTEHADVQTMNFALPLASYPMPALLTQLFDYCSRSPAIPFAQPLIDGTGVDVRFLSLEPSQWQETLEVGTKLGNSILTDSSRSCVGVFACLD